MKTEDGIKEQILIDLIALLQNFNGREYSGTIGPDTFFFRDLEMVSIDAVVFAEMLEHYYGQKFPFHSFLASLKQNNNHDLQLFVLVQFLAQHIKFHE